MSTIEIVLVAIDPATGRFYWANSVNDTLSFARLDGTGGGGQLSTAGATPNYPTVLALHPAPGALFSTN